MAKSKKSTYCKCAHDIILNAKHHTNLPWSMHKEKWQLTHTKLLSNDLQVTKLEATNSANNLKMIRHGQDNVTNLKRKHMVGSKTHTTNLVSKDWKTSRFFTIMPISSLDYCKKTSNTNTLGLIVEFAPPIIHMHVYLSYKKKPHQSKHIYQNKMHLI
jgi:hypothetical protein